MDNGVTGPIGDLAARHAIQGSEQDPGRVPIQQPLMAENLAWAMQAIRGRATQTSALVVSEKCPFFESKKKIAISNRFRQFES